MPIGKVRWYDKDRGFGFVSNPGGDDVYIGKNVLPKGVEELSKGQRLEYDFADGRQGPQALRIKVLAEAPRVQRGSRGRGDSHKQFERHKPAELNGMISDMISMLETSVQGDLRNGRYPDRKVGRQVAGVLRAVARQLDS